MQPPTGNASSSCGQAVPQNGLWTDRRRRSPKVKRRACPDATAGFFYRSLHFEGRFLSAEGMHRARPVQQKKWAASPYASWRCARRDLQSYLTDPTAIDPGRIWLRRLVPSRAPGDVLFDEPSGQSRFLVRLPGESSSGLERRKAQAGTGGYVRRWLGRWCWRGQSTPHAREEILDAAISF